MSANKKEKPAWLVLMLIALMAGLILSATNLLTKDKIAQAEEKAQEEARRSVLPAAESFEKMEAPEDYDSLYRGVANGETVGYVISCTRHGYSSDMLLTLGVDMTGTITGLSVGGSSFAETAGLGANAKEASFTDQFRGIAGAAELGGEGENAVDAISGATITSRAVTGGVNEMAEYVRTLLQ